MEFQWKLLLVCDPHIMQHHMYHHSICHHHMRNQTDSYLLSLALGLITSEVTEPPFQNMVITFHETPTFHTVTGPTLRDRVMNIRSAPWGGSTDIQKVFDLILTRAQQFKLSPAQMPKRLFIISDMQFNQADPKHETNHNAAINKYKKAGYPIPQIVYWNVRADTVDFPADSSSKGGM